MPKLSTYTSLTRAGVITPSLLSVRSVAVRQLPIPMDVQHILTEDQAKELAEARYKTCVDFQDELETFYRSHYQKTHNAQAKKMGKFMTESPLELGYIHLGHDCSRTLWYTDKMLKENKPRVALAHVHDLSEKFMQIYLLFSGRNKEVEAEVRTHFPGIQFEDEYDETRN